MTGTKRVTKNENNTLHRYKEALERIEKFGHSHGHGRGYTCANIAEEALKDD
jgi:hypothetical protein